MMSFAQAAVIVTRGHGLIDGPDTIDKYGLFGPPHKNLRGLPFTYRTRYESDQYGPSMNCGTSCLYNNSVPGAEKRAANISITVNGHTLSFNARISGQVEFYNFDARTSSYTISADADFNTLTGEGASLLAWYERPAVFGEKLLKPCFSCELQDYFIVYRTHHSHAEKLSFVKSSIK
jgi:hypothetical protein